MASSVDNIAIEQLYQYNYNDSINNNNILEDNILYINIGTHNVRGFHNREKQRIFMDAYKEYNLDIIGITETKLYIKKIIRISCNNRKII